MISRARIRELRDLHRKKGRGEQGAFLVEGSKSVADLLASDWPVRAIYATHDWPIPQVSPHVEPVTDQDMARISALDTPSAVLAVAESRHWEGVDPFRGRWLALDGVQDPGNLGTLLRLADWFGLQGLLLSPDTVDPTNPKAVQASMGSLFRIPVLTRDLPLLLQQAPPGHWLAGAFLNGDDAFTAAYPPSGILVLGNEGRGIRPETALLLPRRLTIPRFGAAESLNVAMAGSIFCSQWRRPTLTGT